MAEYLQIHRGNILGRIHTNVNNVQNGSVVEFNYRKKDGSQKKYMVTFSDNLPNVNYRFDNFWAFGEIDDYLEPNIEKIE